MRRESKTSVREVVQDYTMYHEGQCRHYVSLSSLKLLIEQICELNECPQYLRITPFYDHCKREFGIEFDEYMCYIETRKENIVPAVKEAFYSSCGVPDAFGSLEAQYSIVNASDVAGFHDSLFRYLEYLYSLLPKLAQDIVKSYRLSAEDAYLGEFCFEIHCE